MADQLEEIKRKIDIVEFINGYLPLKKAGQNFKALCPFHSEKTPSFVVSPERQIWHCFGACSEGGDVFRFLMKMENIDFGEALRELAQKTGIKLTRYQPTEGEKQKQLLYEINHLAMEFFHYLLLNHSVGKAGLDYILGRGINRQSLQLFKLGFAPDSWESLQKFLVGKKGYRVENLETAGLVIRSSKFQVAGSKFYDRFRNRLMFPLKNHRGDVCGFAGRVLDPQIKEARLPTPDAVGYGGQAKYINTPETPIYHKSDLLYGLSETKEAIKKADQAVLVEGELDAISSYQAGIGNVVAIKGSALASSQVNLLSRFTKNLIFALDSDIAGDQAAKRGIEIAETVGMTMRVVEIKGGKDPDEVAQKNPALWQKLVKTAVPVYDFFLDSALARFPADSAEGKGRISQEIIPILAKISDSIVQAHYVKLLAEKLGIDEEAVRSQIAKVGGSLVTPPAEKSKTELLKLSRQEVLEEYLLALGFQTNEWSWLCKREILSLVKIPRFKRILLTLGKYLRLSKKLKSGKLAKILAPELLEAFNKLYLLDLGDLIQDSEKLQSEWQKTINQLREINLRVQLKEVSDQIRKLEKQSPTTAEDQKKLETLNEEFRDFLTQLTKFREKE